MPASGVVLDLQFLYDAGERQREVQIHHTTRIPGMVPIAERTRIQ